MLDVNTGEELFRLNGNKIHRKYNLATYTPAGTVATFDESCIIGTNWIIPSPALLNSRVPLTTMDLAELAHNFPEILDIIACSQETPTEVLALILKHYFAVLRVMPKQAKSILTQLIDNYRKVERESIKKAENKAENKDTDSCLVQ